MKENFGKVAVLCGGNSSEREISLMTGKAVWEALLNKDIDAFLIYKERIFESDYQE